jgi:RimJ/RimL family protein N-acetyltransferase
MGVQHLEPVEPKEPLVTDVFEHLCQSILGDCADPMIAEHRLWTVPETAAHFVFGVTTDDQRRRVAPLIHRLRTGVGELINRRLDRSVSKGLLAQRVNAARSEFLLRPWRVGDARRYAALLESEAVWDALPDEYPGPLSEAMASNLIDISNGWAERHVVFAVEWRGEPIGQARLQFDSSDFSDAAEISYWLGVPYWGRGLGTNIVSLFTAECFRRRPHLNRIFAVVLDGNAASMRVLEKAGYRYESFRYQNVVKAGAKRSSHVFGLCRADYAMPDGSMA